MDFNKQKVFGYLRAHMRYKFYDNLRLNYIKTNLNGQFHYPKSLKNRDIIHLYAVFKQKRLYEKYLNPHGLRQTITANFPRVSEVQDFVDQKIILTRTSKIYDGKNHIKLLVNHDISKPEIEQFLAKVYNINVLDIRTAIIPGRVKRDLAYSENQMKVRFMRTQDHKKALVTVNFDVPQEFREIPRKNTLKGIKGKNKIIYGTNEIRSVLPERVQKVFDLKNIKNMDDVKEYLNEI